MTVNHAWNNPSLQTTRNSIVDIANDLRPALSEKIDRAGAKIRIVVTKLSAGVAKATEEFASSKDRRSPVPETTFGHSHVQTNEHKVGMAARTARSRRNQHAWKTEPAHC